MGILGKSCTISTSPRTNSVSILGQSCTISTPLRSSSPCSTEIGALLTSMTKETLMLNMNRLHRLVHVTIVHDMS